VPVHILATVSVLVYVACLLGKYTNWNAMFPIYACCSRTFFIYLFLRFTGVSYGQFIAIHFGFNLSTYIQNCWWQVGGERFKWPNGWERLTDTSNPVWKQSRTRVVWGSTENWLCHFPRKWSSCLTGYSTPSSSSSSSYIFHGVGPLVDLFQSNVSRSLFKGLPWFLLPVGE